MKSLEMEKCNAMSTEVSKTSTLSSGKIDRHEYITVEEMLPSDQSKMTEQAKFTYYLLG